MSTRDSDDEAEFFGLERQTPEQEEDADKSEALRLELRRQLLVGLMQNDLFRGFLMEELMWLETFGNPVIVSPNGSPDPHATFFALGQKAYGWRLWTMFDNVAPELTGLMRREFEKPKG